jgi:hypothetical protein
MRNRPAVEASPDAPASIDAVLDCFGNGALRLAANVGVRVIHLRAAPRARPGDVRDPRVAVRA